MHKGIDPLREAHPRPKLMLDRYMTLKKIFLILLRLPVSLLWFCLLFAMLPLLVVTLILAYLVQGMGCPPFTFLYAPFCGWETAAETARERDLEMSRQAKAVST